MAKVTNFLSIALLVSVFAVTPAFAACGIATTVANGTHKVLNLVGTPVNKLEDYFSAPAREAAPARDAVPAVVDANGVETAPAQPAVAAVEAAPASVNALYRSAKYAMVIALVVSNPAVQGAVSSVVDAVKNALGMNEDEADETVEPTRLVIGRQA